MHNWVRMSRIAPIALFMTGALCLVLKSGYTFGPALLALMGVACLRSVTLPSDAKALLATFGLYGVGTALFMLGHGSEPKFAANYLYFAIFPLLVFTLLTCRPSAAGWFLGVAVGGVGAGLWALWNKFVLHMYRAGGHTYVIQHGNIGLMLGVMSLLGLLYFWSSPPSRARTLLLSAGALGGFMTSVLSGTRGGWIGLPVLFYLLWQAFAPLLSQRMRVMAVSGVLVLLTLVVALPQTSVRARIQEVHDELVLYSQGQEGWSVAPRIDMWTLGIAMIPERPWLGWGQAGYEAERDRRIALGLTRLKMRTPHLHNEMLDTVMRHGVIGGLLLLLLYVVPIRLFRQGFHEEDVRVRALAIGGVITVVMYIDFGLSQVFFERNSGRMVYMTWVPILWALYWNARQAQHSESAPPACRSSVGAIDSLGYTRVASD